jgi:2-dehydro-3-deoxyphosphogluconate aldolase / (4S)-4-hydroxy-2-oxoglutarate aldolase
MDKERILDLIHQHGIIPAIRTASSEDAIFAARAVYSGGIPIAEVTMTIPGALEVIRTLSREIPEMIVGAGTLWQRTDAESAVEAGARFLTTTGLVAGVLEFAVREKIPAIPGALTPTEIATAWLAGADLVKIFPCSQVGGPAYIRMMTAPFPDVPFVASGGVTQRTAGDFVLAGAAALGIGSDLIPPDAVRNRHSEMIRELVRRFIQMVQEGRDTLAHKRGGF